MAACESGDFARANDLGTKALQLAADPAERYLALAALGVAALRQGVLSASTRYWERLAADEDSPAGYRASGFASLALIACYNGDPQAAQRHAARARLAAAASGSGAFRAFASYAAGETALAENQLAGIGLLRAAADEAAATGAGQVVTVALIALVSALTRLERHDEALAVFPSLLEQARRNGDWPYLWTALRIGAELLAASGQPETAALLLAAARHAPSAPAVTGADVARYRDLEQDLERQLGQQSGPGALGQIDTLARTLPRAQVLDRALCALTARGQEVIAGSLSSRRLAGEGYPAPGRRTGKQLHHKSSVTPISWRCQLRNLRGGRLPDNRLIWSASIGAAKGDCFTDCA